jgi:hypothetical protein
MGGGGDGYGGVRYQEWTKLAKARVLANDNSPTNSPRLIGADSQLAVIAPDALIFVLAMKMGTGIQLA